VASGSSAATVIDGLTIKNGKGTKTNVGKQTYYCGGGIYAPNASPTITNNKITGNTVLHLGAGIYCTGASVKIVGNTITSNTARNTGLTGYGGGIYLSAQSGVVSNNTISGNKANHSGVGMCCAASAAPSIFNNVITGNGSMDGGGIFCDMGAKPLIASNQLTGNQATHGGGLFCGKNADVTCVNNTFVSNTASPGGGISLYSCKATITNNIIAFNSSGIGRAGYGNHTLKNNCVYKSASVNYDGLPAGSTDINKDPLLVDMSRGNFHLRTTSPCINAGYDTVVQSGWLDIDGVARILGGRVDIGADEAR
jgi:parallel beta-helix repeat protein